MAWRLGQGPGTVRFAVRPPGQRPAPFRIAPKANRRAVSGAEGRVDAEALERSKSLRPSTAEAGVAQKPPTCNSTMGSVVPTASCGLGNGSPPRLAKSRMS